jgi:hypothetical protein
MSLLDYFSCQTSDQVIETLAVDTERSDRRSHSAAEDTSETTWAHSLALGDVVTAGQTAPGFSQQRGMAGGTTRFFPGALNSPP